MLKNKDATVPELIIAISNYLDCPCEYFPSMPNDAPLMEAYHRARERGQQEGFIPVFVVADDLWGNLDAAEINKKSNSIEEAQNRQKILSTPIEDGKTTLDKLLNEYKETMEEYGMSQEELDQTFGEEIDWNEIDAMSDELSDSEPSNKFYGLNSDGNTNPAILVEVPVKNPWEIFAYLPFGGWNECPNPETHMAIAKYWYEKYDAVPAVITMDTLEFLLPASIPKEQAMELAKEQYVYCTDIVDQGVGSINALASVLINSKIWFFWWD